MCSQYNLCRQFIFLGKKNISIRVYLLKVIIKVINKYSDALNLLDDYDYRSVSKPKGTK